MHQQALLIIAKATWKTVQASAVTLTAIGHSLRGAGLAAQLRAGQPHVMLNQPVLATAQLGQGGINSTAARPLDKARAPTLGMVQR